MDPPPPTGAASRPAYPPKLMANYFDPVAYVDNGVAEQGSRRFQRIHDGGLYYFGSQANLDRFMEDPTPYIPAFRGWCSCAMAQGMRKHASGEHFKIVDGALYLFHDGEAQAEWQKDPSAMITQAKEKWATMNRLGR